MTMATVYKRNGKGYWWIGWTDEQGKRRAKSSRTTDKRAAERIVAKLEAAARLRAEGVIDPRADRFAKEAHRPLSEHIADYEAACQDARQAEHTIATKIRRLRYLAQQLEAERFSEFVLEGVGHAIASMNVRHRDGLSEDGSQRWRNELASARTRNAVRSGRAGSSSWCWREWAWRLASSPW